MGRGLGRGFMAGGRGAPSMGRGGRGRGGRGRGGHQMSHEHQQKPVVVEDHEPEKSTNVTEVENPDHAEGKGDDKSPEANLEDNVLTSETSIPQNGENDGSTSNEDQSKNVISGQVCT